MSSASTPLLHTLQETGHILGQGLTTVYGMIHRGELDARKVGRRTMVTDASVKQLVKNLPKADLRGPAQKAA